MDRNKVNRDVKELTEKLIQGWTLLTETCPEADCNVPLLKDLQGRPFCISCNTYADTRQTSSRPPASAAPSSASASSAARPTSASITTSTPAGKRAAAAAGVDRESPELSRIDDTPSREPALNMDDDDDMWAPPTAEERKAIEARRAKSDKDSAEIAKYMLAGWTMLNDHCPNSGCAVPLVGNKEKKMYCVSCGSWMMREEDAAAANLIAGAVELAQDAPAQSAAGRGGAASYTPPFAPAGASGGPSAGSGAAAAAAASPAYARKGTEQVESKPAQQQQQQQQQAAVQSGKTSLPLSQSRPPAVAAPAAATLSLSGSRNDKAAIVQSTAAVLYAKLDQARTRLVGAESVDEVRVLVALIGEVAAALKAVEAL